MKRNAIAHFLLLCLFFCSSAQPKSSAAYNLSRVATVAGVSGMAVSGYRLFQERRRAKRGAVVARDTAVPLQQAQSAHLAVGPRGHIVHQPASAADQLVIKKTDAKLREKESKSKLSIQDKQKFWWRMFGTSAIMAALGSFLWWHTKPQSDKPSPATGGTQKPSSEESLSLVNNVAAYTVNPEPALTKHTQTDKAPTSDTQTDMDEGGPAQPADNKEVEGDRPATPVIAPPATPISSPPPSRPATPVIESPRPEPKEPPKLVPSSSPSPRVSPVPPLKFSPSPVRSVSRRPVGLPPLSDSRPPAGSPGGDILAQQKKELRQLAALANPTQGDIAIPMSIQLAKHFLEGDIELEDDSGRKDHMCGTTYRKGTLAALSPLWAKLKGTMREGAVQDPGIVTIKTEKNEPSERRLLVNIKNDRAGNYRVTMYDKGEEKVIIETISRNIPVTLKIFKQKRTNHDQAYKAKYALLTKGMQNIINHYKQKARKSAQAARQWAEEQAQLEEQRQREENERYQVVLEQRHSTSKTPRTSRLDTSRGSRTLRARCR